MSCNKEYEKAEEQEIIKVYGEFSDENIRRFIKEGLVEKFHDEYLQKHRIKNLNDSD